MSGYSAASLSQSLSMVGYCVTSTRAASGVVVFSSASGAEVSCSLTAFCSSIGIAWVTPPRPPQQVRCIGLLPRQHRKLQDSAKVSLLYHISAIRAASGFRDGLIVVGMLEARHPRGGLMTALHLRRHAQHVLPPGGRVTHLQAHQRLIFAQPHAQQPPRAAHVLVLVKHFGARFGQKAFVAHALQHHPAYFRILLLEHILRPQRLWMAGNLPVDGHAAPANHAVIQAITIEPRQRLQGTSPNICPTIYSQIFR